MKTRKATPAELAKYREMTEHLYDALRANLYQVGDFCPKTNSKLSRKIDAALAALNGVVTLSGLRIIVSK